MPLIRPWSAVFINFADQLGLKTGVIVWQPVGWGELSFGHISIDISGTSYSFGPKGMTIMSTADYAAKNGFRNGMEVFLDITPQQEAALQGYLSSPQGDYDIFTGNTCVAPVQRGLKRLGIDTGHQILPVSLGNALLDMGIVNGTQEYQQTTPSTGTSAPWAR